jgi:hypothetical protein
MNLLHAKKLRVKKLRVCFALLGLSFIVPVYGQAPSSTVKVSMFATGLSNPRGLKFGPDGNLYVAGRASPPECRRRLLRD